MTRDDIIRMAREAGDSLTDKHGREDFIFNGYGIERFAALVAAAEREACIKLFSEQLERFAALVAEAEREACAVIAFNAKTYIEAAKAIRARGQE
jgi:hypothetical protein